MLMQVVQVAELQAKIEVDGSVGTPGQGVIGRRRMMEQHLHLHQHPRHKLVKRLNMRIRFILTHREVERMMRKTSK